MFEVEVIKFDKKIGHLKIPRLDSSDLLIAQLVERQTSIRRSNFSHLNLYSSPCARA